MADTQDQHTLMKRFVVSSLNLLTLYRHARKAPSFRSGMDSADGE